MKNFVLFISILVFFTDISYAQQIPKRSNSSLGIDMGVHFQGIGITRIHFDKEVIYWPGRGVSMGARLAVGRPLAGGFEWGLGENNSTSLTAAAYLLTGRKNHHFEAALGPEFFILPGSDVPFLLLPYADAGYRFQKPEGGLFFRARAGVTSGVGLGIGYSFPVKGK